MLKHIVRKLHGSIIDYLYEIHKSILQIAKDIKEAKQLINDVLRVQEEQNKLLKRTGGDKKKILEEISKQ